METISIKALANKVLERNKLRNQTETETQNSGNLEAQNKDKSFHECFDPDELLADLFLQGRTEEWEDDLLLDRIEALRQDDTLREPWGFKVKDNPLIGDYWIISDTTAREKIPVKTMSFTLEELRPIVETSRVFNGAKVVNVIEQK